MKKQKSIFILSFILLTFCSLSLFADWDFVAGGYISEIQFIGDEGWAVLSEGLVIHTADGGITWDYQETATTERLYDVSFINNLEGWVAGNDGLIFHTTDGGNTWISQYSTTTTNLQSIIFVDALNGWAAGSYGEIIHTSDGGVTWTPQTSSISSKIYSIFFIDSLNGWGVAASDYIIHTTDGGATWSTQTNPTTDSMKDVIFYDVNEGWATGSNTIIHTVDGGTTWVNQVNPADENLYGIGMGDNHHLWVVGIDGEILATTDGGTTWVEQSFSLDWLLGVHFENDLTGWIVGSGGAIYKTTDGGSNWIAQRAGTSAGLRRTVFVDEDNVWGCGTKGFIIHSGDGGLTWEGKDSGFDDWIWDITFASDNLHGWAAGDDQAGETPILATVDGGETWIQQPTGIYVDVIGIEAVSNTEVFAAAKSGIILHTTDGGTTWNQQTSGVYVDFKSIEMVSEDIGWIVGSDGTILYTNDGGTTWTQQTSGTVENIYDISFVDLLIGWAVAYNGVILHTTDGGTTWNSQTSGTGNNFTRVSAIDLNEVWAIAGGGFHTTDGGVTWDSVPIPCSIGLWGLAFANNNLGIAMGNGGIIARYTSTILNPPQNLFVDETGYATWDAPLARDLLGYNVYLDGAFIDFTTDLFWQYTDLMIGQTYTGGVTALYDEGESLPMELEFIYIAETFEPPENVQVDPATGIITWEGGGAIFFDNFDSYTAGEFLCTQTTDWVTWSGNVGGPDDVIVVDELSLSGSNSIKIEGLDDDIVHLFGNLTTGVYEISHYQYLVPGYGGYFNLLHEFTGDRTRTEWALEVYFGSVGIGYINAGGLNAATFTYTPGAWVECWTMVDLDNDWAEVWIDGNFVHEWQWSLQFSGGAGMNMLGAIDIWAGCPAGDLVMYYVDDVQHALASTSDELLGYNIYLDGVFLDFVTGSPYQLTGLVVGQTYIAGVSSVYDDGESEIIEVTFTYSPIFNPPQNLAVVSNPTDNWATFVWEAPGRDNTRDLLGYDVHLDGVVVGTTTEVTWFFFDLENGVFYDAGVVAVYDEGNSDLVEVNFEYAGTGTENILPLITKLTGNYPNPFNPTTTINFSTKETGYVSINIYNMRGQLVKTLVNGELDRNYYEIVWDGKDNSGKSTASGIYFYKMKAQDYNSTKKMILMK